MGRNQSLFITVRSRPSLGGGENFLSIYPLSRPNATFTLDGRNQSLFITVRSRPSLGGGENFLSISLLLLITTTVVFALEGLQLFTVQSQPSSLGGGENFMSIYKSHGQTVLALAWVAANHCSDTTHFWRRRRSLNYVLSKPPSL